MQTYKGFENKFTYVKIAAQRAKQILKGARKLVDTPANNPLTIALDEMRKGLVTAENIKTLYEDNIFYKIDEGEKKTEEFPPENEMSPSLEEMDQKSDPLSGMKKK